MSAGSNRADGLVTHALWQQVAKQVEDHGLVVWYDPEGHYASVASRLSIAKTTVVCYNGSFLQLRREIDPLLNDLHPPRLVVYVPMEQAGTDHALIELKAVGVVVQPGQQPPQPQHPALSGGAQRLAAPPWRCQCCRDREAGRGGQADARRSRCHRREEG